ncbi:GNAT family N-acetyltransferase [Plantactinospora siamensis]|uniref:GNAT family N-acetyltransferase n=1 Tax=Plantactinospora siamensis TaxID=555372 RepID=A0ABV6P2R4_9ACTN
MLRPATDDDLDAMRQWRNQPPNREVSITSHEITPAEHAAWWSRTRTDPTRRVLIYERDGVPAGVVNFFDLALDGPAPVGSWGFFLDAAGLDERRETLPAWLEVMREAVDHAFDELRLAELRGEVLAGNEVVRQMNRRFRFAEGQPEVREVDGRSITVIPISLARANRRRR